MPVIAFSTDSNVAARGVYLLSFLPESDVDRIIGYAAGQGKRSIAALVPDNAYGSVVEAAFKQVVERRGGRVVALERYPADRAQMQGPVRNVAQAASRADAIFVPDGARRGVHDRAERWSRAASTPSACSFSAPACGRMRRSSPILSSRVPGMRAPMRPAFAISPRRYRTRYGQDPVRTASLAYDAVALVAALVKTQGKQRFSEEVLTNSSGFTGIDGLFRFRPDGTNQRGLAVLTVSPTGGQIISPPPKGFGGSGT